MDWTPHSFSHSNGRRVLVNRLIRRTSNFGSFSPGPGFSSLVQQKAELRTKIVGPQHDREDTAPEGQM